MRIEHKHIGSSKTLRTKFDELLALLVGDGAAVHAWVLLIQRASEQPQVVTHL